MAFSITVTWRWFAAVFKYSIIPLIRTANYPDWLGCSGKSVENSTQLTYLEITGYQIKHSTVMASAA